MASSKKRKKRRPQNNSLVLKLLILVMVVLVVFEGQLIRTMFSQRRGGEITVTPDTESAAADTDPADSTSKQNTSRISVSGNSTALHVGLAGLARLGTSSSGQSNTSAAETEIQTEAKPTDPDAYIMELSYVVQQQSEPVDDSYFADAVFIGDSRMEGFRNASGITQGDFLTSVGMALSSLGDTKVSTSEGTISVYQGLSGKQYSKIYLMLGANDLGYYPMENFPVVAEQVLNQIHELQPNAVIYICSVIYVEEDKVTTDYVNNANVVTVNNYLLQACNDLSYCYYLNLNEIFSNGWQQLIYGASADGVHLNPEYLEQMLSYMKSHYLVWDSAADASEEDTDTAEEEGGSADTDEDTAAA